MYKIKLDNRDIYLYIYIQELKLIHPNRHFYLPHSKTIHTCKLFFYHGRLENSYK